MSVSGGVTVQQGCNHFHPRQLHFLFEGHSRPELWLLGWDEGANNPLCLRITNEGAAVVPQVLASIGTLVLM